VRVAKSAESPETNARLRDLAKVGVYADPCSHDARLLLKYRGACVASWIVTLVYTLRSLVYTLRSLLYALRSTLYS
jgi:hypothetical protein